MKQELPWLVVQPSSEVINEVKFSQHFRVTTPSHNTTASHQLNAD